MIPAMIRPGEPTDIPPSLGCDSRRMFPSVATTDGEKARARFLHALRRIASGLDTQRGRIMARTASTPKLFAGTGQEETDLTGDPCNDLDYYIYELARLRELAREINKAFDSPVDTVDALAAFEEASPALREIRNPLTHPSDDKRLDNVAWFDAVVRLLPHGAVEFVVDPRYRHHDAAVGLSAALWSYLEGAMPVAAGDP